MADLPAGAPYLAIVMVCSDWRLHQACVDLNGRIAAQIGANGVDLVALPGPDGLFSPSRAVEWAAAVSQVRLLIAAHAPFALVVTGHQRCAGHPVADLSHEADVLTTAGRLKAATGFTGPIHAMMLVYRTDREWDIKPVAVI